MMLKGILETALGTLKINKPFVICCPPDAEVPTNTIPIISHYRDSEIFERKLVMLPLYEWLNLSIPYRVYPAQQETESGIRYHEFVFMEDTKRYKCISDCIAPNKLIDNLKTYFKYLPNVKK